MHGCQVKTGEGRYRNLVLVDLQSKLGQTGLEKVCSSFVISCQSIDHLWEVCAVSFGV
jgi:hypothetical protein